MKKQAPMPGKGGSTKLHDTGMGPNKNSKRGSPTDGMPKGEMTKIGSGGRGFGQKKGQ